MVCIYCGSPTRVTNSRRQKQTGRVWRRRLCVSCGAVFTSTESVDYPKSFMLELPDKSLMPFTRDKLFLSIYKSSEHRESAVDDAAALTDTVIAKLIRSSTGSVVTAHKVAQLVYETLEKFDHASSVQYAAYHSDYKL